MQNNSDKILVSIGMATRNHGHFIHNAVDSLLAQTYKNIELIILDGASEDNTKEVCEGFAKKDNRVRFIRSEENQGLLKDFERVLEEGQGKYFFWASDDDWWHPKFIEKMLNVLEDNPHYGVAMSHFSEHFNYKYDPEKIGKVFKHDFTGKKHSYVYKQLIRANMNPVFVYGFYRRELLNKLYARLMPNCTDGATVFLCEVALSTHFYSVPEILHSKYRNPEPLRKRHAFIAKEYQRKLPKTRYIFTILGWLISSRNIPLSRKTLIFGPWFRYFWGNKYGILRELTSKIQYA